MNKSTLYRSGLIAFSCAVLGLASAQAQDLTWFSDGTQETGLENAKGFRINIVDLNNDDYPDLILENGQSTISKRDTLGRLYLNTQKPGSTDPRERIFVDITHESGIYVNPDASQDNRVIDMMTLADVNNDGFMDMVTGTYYSKLEAVTFPDDRCEVMLGDGTGKFTLVPNNGLHELGLINANGFTFLDYDLDGNIDLYISTLFKDLTNNIFMEDFLMRGNGDGTFTNMTAEAGMINTKFPVQGATSTDWNNDGWPDIMTSAYCRSGGSLWRNNGNGTFTDVAALAGYSSQKMHGDVDGLGARALCQWAALPEDFDNDGDMDVAQMLVHGGLDPEEGRSVISVNQGHENGYSLVWDLNRIRRDDPQSFHLGDEDGAWFDMDNDGWLDLAIAQCVYVPATDRTYIMRQNQDHNFDDVTEETGLLYLKETHNVRPFDYDLDGDQDLLVELWRMNGSTVSKMSLVKNNIGNKNNWANIKLIAPAGVNKNAIGARITVYAGGLAQIREVRAGQGHFGAQQPLMQTVGLGSATWIDSVVVQWPSKTHPVTVVVNPPVNQLIQIDGQGLVVSVSEEHSLSQQQMAVYPNPATDVLFVRLPVTGQTAVLEVYTMLGRRVMTQPVTAGTGVVPLSTATLPAGMYTLRLLQPDGTVLMQSFVRQ